MENSSLLMEINSYSCKSFNYRVFFCKNLKNSQEIFDKYIQNQPQITSKSDLHFLLLEPSGIFHLSLLPIAINKSLMQAEDSCMKTRSLTTEIIYNLSPSTGISESLKSFGFNSKMKNALLIAFEDSCTFFEDFHCEWGTLQDFYANRDLSSIRKAFGIDQDLGGDEEQTCGIIQNVIVTKDI